jgi:hypothetical protein
VIISPTDRAVESSPSVPSNGMNVETSKDPSDDQTGSALELTLHVPLASPHAN